MKSVHDIIEYRPLVEYINKAKKGEQNVIIAIEGRSASGKTLLANFLQEAFDCNVFHMDDFFLPFELKTKERLQEPGGNVHYERFYEEVLSPLIKGLPVIHRPYNCQVRALDQAVETSPKKISIVEGVYSLHPSLQKFYDFKVFMTVDKDVQLERIGRRNGEEKLQTFIERWIPMEEYYFQELKIEEQCQLMINTTNMFS